MAASTAVIRNPPKEEDDPQLAATDSIANNAVDIVATLLELVEILRDLFAMVSFIDVEKTKNNETVKRN